MTGAAEAPRPENEKGREAALFTTIRQQVLRSALARLETRIALADHEYLAATTHDLAVAMTLLCGLEGRQHFHGTPRGEFLDTENAKV
jgi:hypothetical protein